MTIKKCKCGSTDFYNEDDTWRCDKCQRLAEFTTSEKSKNNDERKEERNA